MKESLDIIKDCERDDLIASIMILISSVVGLVVLITEIGGRYV